MLKLAMVLALVILHYVLLRHEIKGGLSNEPTEPHGNRGI
jgi:hypothetical protein